MTSDDRMIVKMMTVSPSAELLEAHLLLNKHLPSTDSVRSPRKTPGFRYKDQLMEFSEKVVCVDSNTKSIYTIRCDGNILNAKASCALFKLSASFYFFFLHKFHFCNPSFLASVISSHAFPPVLYIIFLFHS